MKQGPNETSDEQETSCTPTSQAKIAELQAQGAKPATTLNSAETS